MSAAFGIRDSPHVVYGSTYLNSSKKLSRYPDFHFPEEWPHYVSRAQAQDYLRAYAGSSASTTRISFNSPVTSAAAHRQGWRVKIEGEASPRLYAGLIVANGHHWEAFTPSYPGTFTGEMLHSHDVKSKEQLKGKRVLVVGAGNSAVDILSDAANENGACRAFHAPHLLFLPQDGVRQADRCVHRLRQPSTAAAQLDAPLVSLGHADRGRTASPLRPGAAGPRSVRGAPHRLHHLYRSSHPRAHRRASRPSSVSTAGA